MHAAVTALLDGQTVDREVWRSLWGDLRAGHVDHGQAVAFLSSVSTRLPDHATLLNLLDSLGERRGQRQPAVPGAVNVVGTGGGPPTLNVSTAAAFVAAAMGVPVIKTGSRAYTSSCGSIDLLDLLGVPVTSSDTETREYVAEMGIAFAGQYVYPRELTLLARKILPLGMKSFGRFLNALGPFLAAVPVESQVTGVSRRELVVPLSMLAASFTERDVWVVSNAHGVDELIGFSDNRIAPPPRLRSWPMHVRAGSLGTAAGSLADLRPWSAGRRVDQFLDAVAGRANEATNAAVALNAACLSMATCRGDDWPQAVAVATTVMLDGAASDLVHRMSSRVAPRGKATVLDG